MTCNLLPSCQSIFAHVEDTRVRYCSIYRHANFEANTLSLKGGAEKVVRNPAIPDDVVPVTAQGVEDAWKRAARRVTGEDSIANVETDKSRTSPAANERVCDNCGEFYVPKRSDAKFCTPACRIAKSRKPRIGGRR